MKQKSTFYSLTMKLRDEMLHKRVQNKTIRCNMKLQTNIYVTRCESTGVLQGSNIDPVLYFENIFVDLCHLFSIGFSGAKTRRCCEPDDKGN